MTLLRFFRDQRGATSIEYALIASLIGMVIIGAVMAIGQQVSGTFNEAAAPLG
jgi:pilus assembly protein Flp/PilA